MDFNLVSKHCKKSLFDLIRQTDSNCYELKLLEWGKRTNSCIRVNTRELDRELFTKQSILYTSTDGPC